MESEGQRGRALLLVGLVYVFALAIGFAVARYLPFSTALVAALAGDVAATLIVFVFSRITGNSSLYDPYWSVVPPAIALFWVFSLLDSATRQSRSPALWIALVPLFFWAVRLTWNWIRRWKGPADEDWRYEMLKRRFKKADILIDFLGIHMFPTMQVFLGLIPLYFFVDGLASGAFGSSGSWAVLMSGASVMLLAILLETVADRQLSSFRHGEGRDGLLQTGVWKVVSHPNYLGEILFWWGLWVASLSGGAPLWSVTGPVAMTVMFLFVSVPMMDRHLRDRVSSQG